MKILLLGEYSNVHATLAKGLRALGHDVRVASNGDFWKNYPRDNDLSRGTGHLGGLMLMWKVLANLPRWTGYDVVQLINPMFLELSAKRIEPVYRFLLKHNKRIFLGAFGMDYYWVHENITRKPLRYSDFNFGEKLREDHDAMKERHDWIGTDKERLNRLIADTCDGIVAGLYEYWACYHPLFPNKTSFIPFPIHLPQTTINKSHKEGERIKLFIGINRTRNAYKGTDIMLKAAKDIAEKYPDDVELQVAVSVPFDKYQKMVEKSDAILDQLYSYTPSMNPLMAMSKGIICIGGGEPENYEILHENVLRPIINVEPSYDSVYSALERLIRHREEIPLLQRQSIEYVKKHHDYIKVAKEYIKFWQQERH